MLDRFSLWKAIWLSSALFGLVHSLNVFVTGELRSGLLQAVAASLSGLLFCAIRVRTRSLLPGMLTHGLWDFAVFLIAAASGRAAEATPAPPTGAAGLLPLLLATPGFLNGLYLIRRVGVPTESTNPETSR